MKTQGLYRMLAFLMLLFFVVSAACGGSAPATQTPTTDPGNASIVPEKRDPALAVNSMDQVAIRVTNGTIDGWESTRAWAPVWWGLFWGVIALVVVAFLVGGMANDPTVGFVAGVVVCFIVFFIVRGVYVGKLYDELAVQVEKQATHAMKEGIDGARLDKATTYVEELHVNVVKADRDWYGCEESTSYNVRWGDGSPSECYQYGVPEYSYKHNYQQHCTDIKNEKGEKIGEDCYTDYSVTHVPYITRVVKSFVSVSLPDDLADPETGLVPSSEPNHPRHYFDANWVVPVDYTNFWRDPNKQEAMTPVVHPQWDRYAQMLAQGINPQVNVYHIYTNWLLASDSELVKETSSFTQQYEEAGLLPTMNTIYNANGVDEWAVDYDMVQFMGMDMSPEEKALWNMNAAREYSKYFSPYRQMSLSIVFAPASKVGNIDDYATSVKANFLDTSGKWDVNMFNLGYPAHRLLPKNAALIICTVDDAKTMVLECRLTAAMPKGNEKLIYDFMLPSTAEMQNVPFSPQGFFGDFYLTLSDGSNGFREVEGLTFNGQLRPMSLLLRDPEQGGIKREKMGSYAYRQANVKLDQTDIDNLVAKEVQVQIDLAQKTLMTAFWFFAGLIIALIVIAFMLMAGASH